jgi:hypothetical protein
VVVLLTLMVSSVSAHIIVEPPRPEDAPDSFTVTDKDTIIGDIDINPDSVPTDQKSLNNIVIDPPADDTVTADLICPPKRPDLD